MTDPRDICGKSALEQALDCLLTSDPNEEQRCSSKGIELVTLTSRGDSDTAKYDQIPGPVWGFWVVTGSTDFRLATSQVRVDNVVSDVRRSTEKDTWLGTTGAFGFFLKPIKGLWYRIAAASTTVTLIIFREPRFMFRFLSTALIDTEGNEADIRNADAAADFAQTLFGLLVNSRPSFFDGTNWAIQRGSALDNTISGIAIGAFIGQHVHAQLAFHDGTNLYPADMETFNVGRRHKASTAESIRGGDRTTTALAASATYTGTANPPAVTTTLGTLGANAEGIAYAAALFASAFADQAGTIRSQIQIAGTANWRNLTDTAVAANTATRHEQRALGCSSSRFQFVNGATGQGTFEFESQFGRRSV